MPKRYSHTAIITVETDGKLVNGEWIEGLKSEIEVTGQYFSSNSGSQIRLNINGNEFVVKGEFSTKHPKINGARKIFIKDIGLNAVIGCWEAYQTHSVIYI